MPYFARFRKHEGLVFRLDTRIYLRAEDQPGRSDTCVAAIIGKNPGSAGPAEFNRLAALSLNGDKLLPSVLNRFVDAYRLADMEIPQGAYVRVWNLVYICNKNLDVAIRAFGGVRHALACPTEKTVPPIVWYAWGPRHAKLQPFTARFLEQRVKHRFYYDGHHKTVLVGKPLPTAWVKHTQGMPATPIVEHLADRLRRVTR